MTQAIPRAILFLSLKPLISGKFLKFVNILSFCDHKMPSRLRCNGAITKPSKPRRRTVALTASRLRELTKETSAQTGLWTVKPSITTEHRDLSRAQEANTFVVKAYHHYPHQEYKSVRPEEVGTYPDLWEAQTAATEYCWRVTNKFADCESSWHEHGGKWLLGARDWGKKEYWTIVVKKRRYERGPAKEEERYEEEDKSATVASRSRSKSATKLCTYLLKVEHGNDEWDYTTSEVIGVYTDLDAANEAALEKFRKARDNIQADPDHAAKRRMNCGLASYELKWEGNGIETWHIYLQPKLSKGTRK